MTEKKLYTCDICHTDYADKEKAKVCEKNHKVSTVIKDFRYKPNCGYPNKILVKFVDGMERWYKE